MTTLFYRLAYVVARRPEPEAAIAVKNRDLITLLETMPAIRDTGWLDMLTRTLNSDPAAIERAYVVCGTPDELADSPVDGFAAAFYADFIQAQAAAIRRAVRLMREHAGKMEQESTS